MTKIGKILVPIDGSKKSFQALDRALLLASFTSGEVTCLHVIPHMILGGPRTKAIDKQLVLDAKAIMHKAETHATRKNIKFKEKIIRGSPSLETVKMAKNGKFDHIVMSTTGTGGSKGDLMGSVSNFVVHKSKIPVYLIK